MNMPKYVTIRLIRLTLNWNIRILLLGIRVLIDYINMRKDN